MSAEIVLDVLLVATLVAVAHRAIHAEALFTGVVLYIAFGLLMALTWVRLNAPDLALAEAAIGVGVTGALLLDAAGQLGAGSPLRSRLHAMAHWFVGSAALALTAVVALAAYTLAGRRAGLQEIVAASMAESGVEHAVTAVLLNFRGYDTWLEVGVLLAAAIGLLALARVDVPSFRRSPIPAPRVARIAGSLLVPLAILVGGYLLWRGTHGPGGAFQAGAVVAAAGILQILSGTPPGASIGRLRLGLLLTLGFLAFLLAGLVGLARSRTFLEFPAPAAGTMILMIEVGVMVSTAATLILLFTGAKPPLEPVRGDE
jgi:multisubunit Na+/H+ antiporter MnhB subunit